METVEIAGVKCEVVHFGKALAAIDGGDGSQADVLLEFRTDTESAKAIFANTPWGPHVEGFRFPDDEDDEEREECEWCGN